MMWTRSFHIKFELVMLASVAISSSAFFVSRRIKLTHKAYRWPLLLLRSTTQTQSGANENAHSVLPHRPQKSSNFWIAIPQIDNAASSSSCVPIPAVPRLDHETGLLPPGSYRRINIGDGDGKDMISPCIIAIGIHPPFNANDGNVVWEEGVKNCHKLIDSGLNTFRINSRHEQKKYEKGYSRRKSPSSIALENMQRRTFRTEIRHQDENNFYQTLRRNTPPSVLRSCHFMTNLEMPSILSDSSVTRGLEKELSHVPFGNGWMVRESVSGALLRTKGECLDSVVLEYRGNSPYHLDVLDTLFEIKREGLIRSISTCNFPPSLLRSALECGFDVHSNDVCGNLMSTNNLQPGGEMGVLCNDHGCSRLVSAPLGGGIFSNQFCRFQESDKLSAEFDSVQEWKRYRTIMDTLNDLSLKHQASAESIALRWLLQLNLGDSVSVGTHLGMDFVEEQGGQPYSRHRNLRQVFTFSLEVDDMERLCQASGFTSGRVIDYDIIRRAEDASKIFQGT